MIKLNIEVDTIEELDAIKALFSSTAPVAIVGETLHTYATPLQVQTATVAAAETPTEAPASAEGAVQRRRRTKAEIEAARAAEAGEPTQETAASSEQTEAADQPISSEAPAAPETAAAPAAEEKAPVAAPAEQPAAEAWTMTTLRERIGGLQTYVASARTLEILKGFGVEVAQIAPAPGATITPILAALNVKNLSGLIEAGAEATGKLVAIYDALMAG